MAIIVPLSEQNVAEAGAFLAAEVRTSPKTTEWWEAHLRWLALANPDRLDLPAGFLLMTGCRVSGIHLCIPKFFLFPDGEVRQAMFASNYYVAREERGSGGIGLFLKFRKLLANGPLFNITANPASSAVWRGSGAICLSGSDREWTKFRSFLPFADEMLHRRSRAWWKLPQGGRNAPAIVHGREVALKMLSSDHDFLEASSVRSEGFDVVADRNPAWLRWRYLENPERSSFLYQWRTSRSSWFIGVAFRSRGYRGQIRSMEIADCWGTGDYEDLRVAVRVLIRQHRREYDLLAVRGLNHAVRALSGTMHSRRLEASFLLSARAGREDAAWRWEISPELGA